MGEFNVNKTDGSLVPTAGYGGMIKINGTTLADLITALNGMTEDQKNRCEILLYLNSENYTNFFVLKRYNENVSAYGSETHDIYSTSHDEVTIYDGTTRITHYATSLHITKLTSGTTAKISRVSGSNGYDLTSSLSSWSILYQDDSVTGGNTYPASQVMMSDGETSVEEAISKHTLGSMINITNYTSTSPYVCPSDGYIRINVRSGGTLYAYIDSILMLGITSATEQNIQSVRVNKGSKIHTSNGTGNMELVFIPLE